MRKFRVKVNGQTYEVEVEEVGTSTPAPTPVEPQPQVQETREEPAQEVALTGEGTPVTAPMPGVILDIKVDVGDQVEEGDVVALLEAMKMENELSAPVSGKVVSVPVTKGANVQSNEVIVIIG
ncbi:MAG: DUF2118 domain-containing protein [Candidatus Syntrophonatronum acetioxidans]|uniref:DUF2118 domain-containing protein n=1 Tax=Candidatus Syntrophonatronum acetioxidans TaxID=1795816 RepID=A0A424YDR5_9FIRM|nr:MAG: DUF2118 domain-containing protein [Candidatus Syntrophonatronum acetioxidans]